jgi:hypothetical protein
MAFSRRDNGRSSSRSSPAEEKACGRRARARPRPTDSAGRDTRAHRSRVDQRKAAPSKVGAAGERCAGELPRARLSPSSVAQRTRLEPRWTQQRQGRWHVSVEYDSSRPAAAQRALLWAALAFACGGRGADSLRQTPIDPANGVASSRPASAAPESSASPASSGAEAGAGSALTPSAASSSSGCSRDPADYIIAGAPEACSARELPECAGGSEPFVDACGCGCSNVPAVPRECRIDCTGTGFCEGSGFENFPDLPATLSIWQEDLQTDLEFSEGGWLIEGACAGDRRFLARGDHYFWQAYVFNSAGAFLSLGTQGDSIDATCGGAHYFPVPVRCAGATITRVVSQDALSHLKVGDAMTLPYARD